MFSYGLGSGTLAWALVPEILPLHARVNGAALAAMCNWLLVSFYSIICSVAPFEYLMAVIELFDRHDLSRSRHKYRVEAIHYLDLHKLCVHPGYLLLYSGGQKSHSRRS